ncbi:MAG TPA: hypothetical protein VFZ83_14990 [Acidimicrobiia bacterium]|nr:hypothetical protein [Acidimicrobiia bacterium]
MGRGRAVRLRAARSGGRLIPTDAAPAPRVCRVAPDVTAVERVFDYLVPDALAARVEVGALVRVELHGRRVGGWVVALDTDADVPLAQLRPLLAVVSVGPPPDVVELSEYVARRWHGPRVAVLRSASPPNRVRELPARDLSDGVGQESGAASDIDALVARVADAVRERPVGVVRWPPLLDRRRLVAALLPARGSAVVVVADAPRATAFAQWLRARGRDAVVLHSATSDAQRTVAWARAAAGDCVVVGGRLAALAPVRDLSGAIVLDDADEALQEERAPTWHARDVVVERCARAGVPCTIVSPVPTLDALALVDAPVTVPSDIEARGWPRLEVVDRRELPPGAGLFSPAFVDALHDAMAKGGPAVCVVNRRGRLRLLACDACGRLTRWDRTGAPVWSDAGAPDPAGGAARPSVCPYCGATRLRVLRAGVTRVRDELAALVPRASVVELDADIDELAPDADIVIGTEAVFHRAALRRRRPPLVAFLDFDQELLAARYRAAEHALWLLVRAAQLLAARPRSDSRLLVQTRDPDHDVLAAATGDVDRVVDGERARRRALGLPPFGALAELRGSRDAIDAVVAALTPAPIGVRVLGPAPDGDGARVLVRSDDHDGLAAAVDLGVRAGRGLGRVRTTIDPPRV